MPEPNDDEPLKSLTGGERPEPAVPDDRVALGVADASLNMHDLWTRRVSAARPTVSDEPGLCRPRGGWATARWSCCTRIGDPAVAGDETLDLSTAREN